MQGYRVFRFVGSKTPLQIKPDILFMFLTLQLLLYINFAPENKFSDKTTLPSFFQLL